MSYQPIWIDGSPTPWGLGKIVCVGRNYREHAAELNNEVPDRPLLFMKPSTSAVHFEDKWNLPDRPLHYEAEIAVLIGKTLSGISSADVNNGLAGIGMALDLTDRVLQTKLKGKGHPWERAKAFDHSAPMTSFLPISKRMDLVNLEFSFTLGGAKMQSDSSANMVFSIADLISDISASFTLHPGDVVLTGTPAGVGVLDLSLDMALTIQSHQWLHSANR